MTAPAAADSAAVTNADINHNLADVGFQFCIITGDINAADVCAHGTELAYDIFVAALDVVDIFNFCHERRFVYEQHLYSRGLYAHSGRI